MPGDRLVVVDAADKDRVETPERGDDVTPCRVERRCRRRPPQERVNLLLDAAEPCPAAARALNLMNVRCALAACSVRFNTQPYQPMERGQGCVYRNTRVLSTSPCIQLKTSS